MINLPLISDALFLRHCFKTVHGLNSKNFYHFFNSEYRFIAIFRKKKRINPPSWCDNSLYIINKFTYLVNLYNPALANAEATICCASSCIFAICSAPTNDSEYIL
jgi:hypothetical protein